MRNRFAFAPRALRNPDVRNIVGYGAATGLAALLTLLQTRVLWRSLTPIDFGLWALIDPMLLPAASLILFGTEYSIVKQLRIDRVPLRVVTGTVLAGTLPATVLSLLATGFAARFLFHIDWTGALVLTLAGEALIQIMQTALRATGAVAGFAAVLLARNVLYLGVLLVYRHLDQATFLPIGPVFLIRGGCVILVSLTALAAMRPIMRVDWARYLDAVRYGFPLLLTILIYTLTDMTDRWFLAEFTGVATVGIYSLHLKIAAILSQAIVIPFGLWFPPERFKRLEDADGGQRFFILTATVLTLICGTLSGAVWLARDVVLPLIAPGVVASPFILACCLGAVTCMALSQALNVGLLVPGHTGKNVICTTYAVVATVVAAGLLVPHFGMNGAATSRLLGGVIVVSATAAWSHRVFPIAFPVGAMVSYFVASAVVAAGIDKATNGYGLAGIIVSLIAWAAVSSLFAVLLFSRLRRSPRPQSISP